MEVNIVWTVIYLVLAVPLIIIELIGVYRRQKGDTISENVWWIQKKFWPIKIVISGFLIWLLVHFWSG